MGLGIGKGQLYSGARRNHRTRGNVLSSNRHSGRQFIVSRHEDIQPHRSRRISRLLAVHAQKVRHRDIAGLGGLSAVKKDLAPAGNRRSGGGKLPGDTLLTAQKLGCQA